MSVMWSKLAAVASVFLLCMGGYLATANAATPLEYDLTIDAIPVEFEGDITMILESQTNERAIWIFADRLEVRSFWLTFYDMNTTDEEYEGTNYVDANYSALVIQAENASVETRPVQIGVEAVNGTLEFENMTIGTTSSVGKMAYSVDIRNATENLELRLVAAGLVPAREWSVRLDGVQVEKCHSNASGMIELDLTGPWSNQTLTIYRVWGANDAFEFMLGVLVLVFIAIVLLGIILKVKKRAEA